MVNNNDTPSQVQPGRVDQLALAVFDRILGNSGNFLVKTAATAFRPLVAQVAGDYLSPKALMPMLRPESRPASASALKPKRVSRRKR